MCFKHEGCASPSHAVPHDKEPVRDWSQLNWLAAMCTDDLDAQEHKSKAVIIQKHLGRRWNMVY